MEGRAARGGGGGGGGEARLRGECDSAEEGKLDTSISPEEEKGEAQLRRERRMRGGGESNQRDISCQDSINPSKDLGGFFKFQHEIFLVICILHPVS